MSHIKIPRWLPGAIISFGLVVAILYFVDLGAVFEAVKKANYGILLLGLGISVVWLAVRALAWRTMLRERASFRDVFLTISEGYLMNNFMPFRLGEIGRAFLISRKSPVTFVEALSTIVIERVVDLAFTAVIFAAAIPFVVGVESAGSIAIGVGVLMVVGLFVLYLVARNRDWAMALFRRMSERWNLLHKLDGILDSFFAGLAVLTNGWLFTRFLLWMTLDWLIAIGQYFLIILAFYPQATLLWAMFGLGAAAFGNAIPSLPGAVGTYEGAFAGAMTVLSGDQATALAAALTAHLFGYVVTGVIGIYAFTQEGQTVSSIYRQLKDFQLHKNSPEKQE